MTLAKTTMPDVVLFPGTTARVKLVISESGLYKLVMRSDRPDARKFQDWVTHDVLPAIRKDGMYVMGEEKVDFTDEAQVAEMTMKLMDFWKQKSERLAAENAKLTDQNTAMSAVMGTNLHSVARFARTIPGINTNATKRDLLREGYLYKQGGTYRVYRKFADCFVEKLNEQYGTVDIYVTETGKLLLLGLNRLGKLTRLKATRAA